MTTYSYGQLEKLWTNAGGDKSLAPLMAAIALAESGGYDQATNATDNGGTQTSWGLWQISNGTHSWPGSADPLNAAANAKYAVAKYKSQGLSAWGTYDSGAYQQYYQSNTPAAALPQGGGSIQTTASPGGGGSSWWQWIAGLTQPAGGAQGPQGLVPPSSAANTAEALSGIGTVLGQIEHYIAWWALPSHWLRIVAGLGGAVLVGAGLASMTRTGRDYSVSIPVAGSIPAPGGQLAPAMGIAEVTLGAVLLFFAFHNLPGEVDSFPALLSYLQGQIQGQG